MNESWEYNNHNKLLNLKSNAALLCLEAKLYEPDYVLSIHFYYAFINKKKWTILWFHIDDKFDNTCITCILEFVKVLPFTITFFSNILKKWMYFHYMDTYMYVLYPAGKSSTL